MNTVIITGVNGFVGEHVAREFKAKGFHITGIGHDQKPADKVVSDIDTYIQCDLLDGAQVNEKVTFQGDTVLVHLAGLANVGQSFEQPRRFMTDNGIMVHNLLQAAARDNAQGRSIIVSTAALYAPTQPLPLTESATTNPNSPYAVGKLFAEEITRYYKARGLDTVIARPFNHIGPGQGPGFLVPDLSDQLIAARDRGVMQVGNIETKRDYTDVRDVARAYYLLATAPTLTHDVYNICSGKSLSGREMLDLLKKSMQINDVAIEVDQKRIRPSDIMDIYGDSSRIHNELGWEPEIPIAQTISDFVART